MLKKVKDIYANMYEGEIVKYSDAEFKVLSLLRIKGGENSVLWFGKDTLKDTLKYGRDKLNNAINSLEELGAIIVFTCKNAKDMTFVSNVYYACEYDPIGRNYITANTIEEIKEHALQIRQEEERKYALKNNKVARNFILVERPLPSERKVKIIETNPPTENQYMDNPPTDFPATEEPATENKHIYITKPSLTKLKSIKQLKNNNKEKNNVVVQKDLNLVKSYILGVAPIASDKEVEMISKDILATEKILTTETLNIRFNAIKNYMGKNAVINIIGLIRRAIKEQWSVNTVNTKVVGSFNDYEQRSYDFDSLEKKLLGWDNEQEVAISI